jgi:Plasmid pRiA4b ORF-3-like protein
MKVLPVMERTWLSIRVDLVGGRGVHYWPRPGRVFAAAGSHRFSHLAEAIDIAFARWDRSHLYKFELADGRVIGESEFDDFDWDFLDAGATNLSTLSLGEQFVYEFDFGDSWTHVCELAPEPIDPESELGIVPRSPLPYWGWGSIPDQYGRGWIDDDGEGGVPPDPGLSDLPPVRPGWGPQPMR